MGIPYIAICVVIIVIYVNLRASRAMQRDENIRRSFWDREREANMTRKKSLDGLDYIVIPEDLPPAGVEELSDEARSAASRIVQMREEGAKTVNLTGYTNTDLKLMYGMPNITTLMQYDGHYTLLATALHDCGRALYEAGRYADAYRVLDFAADTRTDITDTYRLLSDLCLTKCGFTPEEKEQRLTRLLETANGLRSLSKEGIERLLRGALERCASGDAALDSDEADNEAAEEVAANDNGTA